MTKSERASQIWAVLAWAAKNRQSMTYGMLSKLIGVPTAALGQLLEPIQSYCLIEELPPLTILVVQQGSGLPGSGFTGAEATEYARRSNEGIRLRLDRIRQPTTGKSGRCCQAAALKRLMQLLGNILV